jgi:hypothetical protein
MMELEDQNVEQEIEWQPVRLVPADVLLDLHAGRKGRAHDNSITQDQGRIIRVRPVEAPESVVLKLRTELGCKSEEFFLVHPDDARDLGYPFDLLYMCSDMFWTD